MSSGRRGGFGSGALAGLIAGLAVALVAAWLTGYFEGESDDPIEQAREVIEDNYFEKVDADELDQASIKGMVEELRKRYDDRFSHYFNPEQLKEFEAGTSGEFEGVGLAVSEVPKGLEVGTVYPDSPAKRAGIREGDVITAVNGKSIAGLPSEVSTARIKGPAGSKVELRVVSARTGEVRDVEVERASVRIPAVQGELRRVDGVPIAYVRLLTFSEGAHGELRDEIERLYDRGAQGLVLDLRGNGGGLLNEAVLTSSIFVEDGVVVSTESRTQGEREYEAEGDAIEPRPTVVLVDRNTASASEIVAAALEAYDLATVVGQRTFGKGTFQEIIQLPSGGALDLTIGQYLTADGESLAGTGLKPEVRAVDDRRTPRTDEGFEGAADVLVGEIASSPQP